jgi:hypothetical protein
MEENSAVPARIPHRLAGTSITNRNKPKDHRRHFRFRSSRRGNEGCYFRFLCLFFRKRFLRLWVAILCLFLFFPLGMIKTLLDVGFHLANKSFSGLESRNGVLGYNDGGVLGNVPGSFLGPFLDDETSKAPQVHILIVTQ